MGLTKNRHVLHDQLHNLDFEQREDCHEGTPHLVWVGLGVTSNPRCHCAIGIVIPPFEVTMRVHLPKSSAKLSRSSDHEEARDLSVNIDAAWTKHKFKHLSGKRFQSGVG